MLLLALAAAIMTIAGWSHIATLGGWDPDDQLRLVQLRDFLGGQGWFDTTQYRLNPPDGAPMHWSRLVELPLALIVLILKPLFGQAIAEMAAGVIVPATGLAIVILCTGRVAGHGGDMRAAMIAMIMVVLSPLILQQYLPMRIDHHGWQAAMAATAYAMLFARRLRHAPLILGLALGIWMHISLEALPLSIAFFAYLGLLWIWDGDAGRTRLLQSVWAFTGSSLLLFFGTQKAGIYAPIHCDTVSPPHMAAIATACLIMTGAITAHPAKRWLRLAAAGAAGGAALAIVLAGAPQCLNGAFAGLDPLVREYWYVNILEGQPIWRHPWSGAATALAPLLTGLVALLMLARNGNDEYRGIIGAWAFFLIYATILSCLIFRTATVAAIIAIPPTALWISTIWDRYRASGKPAVRMSLLCLIFLIAMPASLTAQTAKAIEKITAKPRDVAETEIKQSDALCTAIPSVSALSALPPATFLAPFDMGPAILLTTGHGVVASSHHRNIRGMHDHIAIFRSPPDQGRKLLAAHNVQYIAACPTQAEMRTYAERDPDGLWATLARGETPDWLEPLPDMGDGIRVWRVR